MNKQSRESSNGDFLTPAAEIIFADKNKPSFWLLHSIGWFAYVVIFSFDNILFTHKEVNDAFVIFPLCLSALIAALLTIPLRYIFRHCWQLNPRNLLVVIVMVSLTVAVIWTPSKNAIMWVLIDHKEMYFWMVEEGESFNPWSMLNGLSYSFFMIFVWCNLYFGVNYHFRLVNEKKLHLEAVRLSHQAQIKMLRYQINPHFLFNTLNAISTLVLMGHKEKANGMLVRLSTFLRFSLDNDPEKKIPLYDEIKASMLYLEIEKMRFEDRLSIVLHIEPQAETMMVPSLLLQPLVENSIKYAIAHMPSDGVIEITAYCKKSMLHLCVADNGPGIESILQSSNDRNNNEHKGVGLQNIKDRLAVLYANQYEFNISKNSPSGYKVDIAIPMEVA